MASYPCRLIGNGNKGRCRILNTISIESHSYNYISTLFFEHLPVTMKCPWT